MTYKITTQTKNLKRGGPGPGPSSQLYGPFFGRFSWTVKPLSHFPKPLSSAPLTPPNPTMRHHGHRFLRRWAHYKPQKPQAPPAPPTPPKPPRKPQSFSFHDSTWEDSYSWMSNLSDKVAMRHMDVYMEQEEKYTEAVMSDTERLQAKLQSEMASRFAFDLSTPPLRWGPWYVMSFVFFFFYFLLGFVFIFTIYVDPSCLIPLR